MFETELLDMAQWDSSKLGVMPARCVGCGCGIIGHIPGLRMERADGAFTGCVGRPRGSSRVPRICDKPPNSCVCIMG